METNIPEHGHQPNSELHQQQACLRPCPCEARELRFLRCAASYTLPMVPPKNASDVKLHNKMKLQTKRSTVPPLSVNSVFDWNNSHTTHSHTQNVYGFSDSSGDEYEDALETTKTPLTRSSKMKKLMDSEIDMMELQQTSTPKSSEEFDRILLGSPNSSYIWIKFMAHYVDLAQLNSARNVAERALNTISPELIVEKKNMWLAYLNLEHQFGSDESLSRLVQRAVAYNDPEEVSYSSLGDKSRVELIEQTFGTLIHKFSQNLEIWKLYLMYLLDQAAVTETKGIAKEVAKYGKLFEDMLAQGLTVLPAKTHVSLLSTLACKQYKNNNIQAGRNLFDAILDKYPKLTDQWHIYIDMETGYGEFPKVREIYDRATALHHSSKMATKEHVKEIAVNYLNKKQ